uniref:E-cadherin n=1 Tax=Oopsacas minuta TaxID=111878 RepID=A0A2P1GIZ9_9METZ|nr:E-cadherin [Oopsacas minuta]
MFIIATQVEGKYVTNAIVTDDFGAQSELRVCIQIYEQFNHSIFFQENYMNISLDPLITKEFQLTPLVAREYQYLLLFTTPPNSLFVNDSGYLSIADTQTDKIQTIIFVYSKELSIFDTKILQINILDLQHPPEFPAQFDTIFIYTNASIGSQYQIQQAFDPDQTVLEYSIEKYTENITYIFSINSTFLTLIWNLTDFQFRYINMTIRATDVDGLFGEFTLYVNILPAIEIKFENEIESYNITLPDMGSLFQVRPMGPFDGVSLSIIHISPSEDFYIDTDGYIYPVITPSTQFQFEYTLIIEANLRLSTDILQVLINVDFIFEFISETFKTCLPENTEINTFIYKLELRSVPLEIDYYFDTFLTEFKVNSSGHISLNSNLDYERRKIYNLTLKAFSNFLQKTISFDFFINVTDINDNYPTFAGQAPYFAHIFTFNLPTIVYEFVVIDFDSGSNGMISFQIDRSSVENIFQVSETGQLSFVNDADNFLSSYSIVITAFDNGTPSLATTVILSITVYTDIPDDLPIFEHKVYEIEVKESFVDFEIPLMHIRAFSASSIEYEIHSNPSELNLRLEDQNIYLLEAPDYELSQFYNISISANDGNSTTTCLLFVYVVDVNDNSPYFDQQIYEIFVDENKEIGDVILMLNVTDLDSGLNGEIFLNFTEEFYGKYFEIFGKDLIAKIEFDFEEIQFFEFEIVASDRGQPMQISSSFVHVNIVNINDNIPIVAIGTNVIILPQNATENSEILSIAASDEDNLNSLSFTIKNGFTYFDILVANQVGILSIIRSPVRGTYQLNVTITDGKHSIFVPIYILVGNVNENTPKIEQSTCEGVLMENAPNGTYVAQITAVDEDIGLNGELYFSILTNFHVLSEKIGVLEDVFTIDSNSGIVTLNYNGNMSVEGVKTLIDAEFSSEIIIDVIVVDGGGQEDFCSLTITILDQNDNAPIFDRDVYEITYKQIIDTTNVLNVFAFDPDQGNNGLVSYRITNTNLFIIDNSKGTIISTGSIPSGNYTFIALAIDNGSPYMETEVMVHIIVQQDLPPRPFFDQSLYEVTVREDQQLNEGFLQVNASKTADNTQIIYSVRRGSSLRANSEGTFQIKGITGEIFLGLHLDYEILRPGPFKFSFLVQASNFETSSYALVVVYVLDVNDNYPKFTSPILNFYLDEGPTNRSYIGRLSATDKDSGENGDIEYSLYDTTLDIPFIIQRNGSINIKSQKVFDYEDPQSKNIFAFLVVARDLCGMECSLSTVVSVAININDLNDNTPIFDENLPSSISLLENTVPPRSVGTFHAIDKDEISFDNLEYSITEGNIGDVFSINAENGHLNLVQILDFETQPEYFLTLKVFDNTHFSLHKVHILIVDIDDSIPIFSQPIYEINIPESIPIGTSVANVKASDVDLPENGFIDYEISDQSTAALFFALNNTTGDLRTISEIDREEFEYFEFFCFARDSNNNLGKAIIRANISDINEPPIFSKAFYETFIAENRPISSFVGYFPALDIDRGENSTLKYELLQDENNAFVVDMLTGEVYTQQIFDYETRTMYVLVLRANDSGTPPLFVQTTIRIFIEDVNDHFPAFICTNMYSRIYDDVKNNSVVTKIKVLDDDDTPVFHIQLLTHNLPFIISENEVILIGNLSENSYFLELNLSDFSQNFHQIGNFSITVLPTNRNPPLFTSSTNQFIVLIGSEIGAEIGQISAQDPEGDIVTFFINDTNFRIDISTGTITLNIVPIKVTEIYVNVTVFDSGYPKLSSFILIQISIENSPKNSIIFPQNFYTIELEEEQIFLNFLQIQVLNEISVTYKIEHNFNTFSIDTYNGSLSLLIRLDYEIRSLYNITIETESENGMFGYTYVVISVVDVNDNPSLETFSTIFIRILEPKLALVPITFDDPDSNDQFRDCSYENGSLEFEIFYNCTILINEVDSGLYFVEVSGRDGTHDRVPNHITIDVHNFQYLKTENVFSILFANPLSAILQNISIFHTFFPPNIILYSIEEHLDGGQIHFYSNDVSTALDYIYNTRNSFAEIGFQVESILNEPCESEPCLNQGLCNNSLSIGPINFVTSDLVSFLSKEISHSYDCICAPESVGKNCDTNIDDCLNVVCQNGGNCVDLLQDFYCKCPMGVSGTFCENSIDFCATNPCHNSGNCVEKITHFECDCVEGFYGDTCQYSLTKMVDLCVAIECENNSSCTASTTGHTCSCVDGFIGPTCTNASNTVTPCDSNPCQYGGQCVPMSHEYSCICPQGYSGPDCCYPMDECELKPCQNGGECLSGFYGDYVCECPSGTSGPKCEIFLSPCDVSQCQNGGICSEDGYAYTCSCPIRFAGENCEFPVFPTDFCISNDCQNGANCTSGFNKYTCTCPEGFSGILCQSPTPPSSPCGSNPCQHEGKCVEIGTEIICECIYGVTGVYCENNINDCENISCGFGACFDGFGGQRCVCEDGYSGEDCTIECPSGTNGPNCNNLIVFCSETSCQPGQNCSEVLGGFECHCPSGFIGVNCGTRLSCDNTECENGGNCRNDEMNVFECDCPPKFWGAKCELLRSTSFNGQSFISFPGSILPNQNAVIDFKISTASNNGLILFATNFRNFVYKDFIIVDISHSIIRFTISFGGGNYVLSDCHHTSLSDTIWHNISIAYSISSISICVDQCTKTCELEIDSAYHSLDGILSLLLGGIPYDPSLKIAQNFTGCLRDFYINKQQIDLSDGYHFKTLETCPDTILTPCQPIICPPRSSCVETADGAGCICDQGYSGTNCDEIVQSITLQSGDYLQIEAKNRIRRDLNALNLVLNSFSIAVLPTLEYGTILHITDSSHFLKLELTPTHLELITDTNSASIPIGNTSNTWFHIKFQIERNILTLYLNDDLAKLELNSIFALNSPFSTIFLSSMDLGLQGCIQDIRLNEYQLQETNPAFQLVTYQTNPHSDLGPSCQVACDNSICGFGTCVPLFTQEKGYICECLDGTFQEVCVESEPTTIVTLIVIIVAITLIIIATILTVTLIITFFTHRHYEKEKRYSVQVYENRENFMPEIRRYQFEGGGEGQTGTITGTKMPIEPSILSDEIAETSKFDEHLFRSVILRREAYLCDDDSKRRYSDSEGEETLTVSFSRDSEFNISEVPVETLNELGSPFRKLCKVIYPEFDK